MVHAESTPALRTRILHEALHILDTEGFAALTVRAVAARSGCSTIGVYTHFGGKDGLVAQILTDAWAAFETAVAVVDHGPSDRPGTGVERLVDGAHAYRAWALENRARYLLMFSPGSAAREARELTRGGGEAARLAHQARVRRALELGDLRPADLGLLTASTWAHAHGWVMLELTEVFATPADPAVARATFDAYVRALYAGLARS